MLDATASLLALGRGLALGSGMTSHASRPTATDLTSHMLL